ncbi:MAG TPA: hypothetical protein PKA33_19210 [Amaricoccus sp.]|uniref:hypothetical protein n=1 Tax=Amaricoccus sp. TaxID=1872485 RepID=UPI002C5322EF|nr:hypothetical protein [Amaricoccus sp.]HMU01469.1 hypothetical protein [Amaricoccus sp.]
MSVRSLKALFAAAVVTVGLSAGVQAADVGQCGTPEQMNQWMQAEGQRSLVTGNRHNVIDSTTGQRVNRGVIFTADAAGRVGYELQTDQLMGTPAGKVCVSMRLHDVRLFDPRIPGVPQGAKIAASDEAGRQACKKLEDAGRVGRGSCGPLNPALEKRDGVGDRVLLQGSGVTKQANGTYAPDGTLITLTAIMPGNGTNPDGTRSLERDGRATITFTSLPHGASGIGMVFTDVRLTPHAIERLEPQVAMTGPGAPLPR